LYLHCSVKKRWDITICGSTIDYILFVIDLYLHAIEPFYSKITKFPDGNRKMPKLIKLDVSYCDKTEMILLIHTFWRGDSFFRVFAHTLHTNSLISHLFCKMDISSVVSKKKTLICVSSTSFLDKSMDKLSAYGCHENKWEKNVLTRAYNK
jgi:hypothetical protein